MPYVILDYRDVAGGYTGYSGDSEEGPAPSSPRDRAEARKKR